MNPYLVFVIAALAGNFVMDLVVELLNLRHLDPRLPGEFVGYYDQEKYSRSQNYIRDQTRLALIQRSLTVAVVLAFMLLGGLNLVDHAARSLVSGSILTGLVFIFSLTVMSGLLSLPFTIVGTFVIEARYGFNKTTVATFVLDRLKGLGLAIVLGAPLLSLVLWFFGTAGKTAWLIVWITITLYQLFMTYLAPAVIMPWFNKFTPLEDGELKSGIEAYARAQRFRIKGVFKMDGSRRSSKTNAFFTGFGRFRRIVLFDTLIEKHSSEELLAILAHEMGHCRLAHIPKWMAASILQTGLLLWLLSFFIENPGLFAAFGMEHRSIYASLVFFSFLYSPVSTVLSVAMNWLSRRHEFAADRYAIASAGKAEAFIAALKKLSVDNLSNLTPHPWKVVLEYSHPPVLQRIQALARASAARAL
jgi:STE24 endopeptidase